MEEPPKFPDKVTFRHNQLFVLLVEEQMTLPTHDVDLLFFLCTPTTVRTPLIPLNTRNDTHRYSTMKIFSLPSGNKPTPWRFLISS